MFGELISIRANVVLAAALVAAVVLCTTPQGGAQILGSRYLWTDSIRTTTTAQDSFFTYRWEYLTFYSDSIDVYFKVSGSDTAGWDDKDWMLLEAGDVLTFGPATPVRRLEWKARAGVGTVYFIGIKKEVQR